MREIQVPLRRRAITGLLLGVAVLAAVALSVTGVTPWPAPAVTVAVAALAIGQRTGWASAFAASVIAHLAALAVALRVSPHTGLGVVGAAAVVCAVLGLTGAVVVAADRRFRLPRLRSSIIAGSVVGGAIVLAIALLAVSAHRDAFEWAMRNDAVWNLVTTRLMIADGGVDAALRPNPSPLTAGLLAVVVAVGRDAVSPEGLLRHDVQRVAAFWLVGALVTALLGAVIGWRSVRRPRVAAVTAAVCAGLVPLTWFGFGFALEFGFVNATVALVLLLACWICWQEARAHPLGAAAASALAGVGLLATWAPCASAAAALGIASAVAHVRVGVRGGHGWRSVGQAVLALSPVPLYVATVSLTDLGRDGAALGVDGAVMPLTPLHVAVILGAAIAAFVATAGNGLGRHDLTGLFVLTAGAGAGLAYLVFQRRGEADAWGYYPAKFAWIMMTLVLVLLAVGLVRVVAGARRRAIALAAVAAVAVGVPAWLMASMPPFTDRSASVMTPVAIATGRGVAAGAPASAALFPLAEPGRATMVIRYGTRDVDRFVDGWLLQLESDSGDDPIRVWSYVLDPTDDGAACEAVRAWDRPVRIVTSDPALADRFADGCPGVRAEIDVRTAP